MSPLHRRLLRKGFFASLLIALMIGSTLPIPHTSAALVMGSSLSTQAPAASTAIIWTNQTEYYPGSTVTIYGSGFAPSSVITVSVTRPDGVIDTWNSIKTDQMGGFITTYVLSVGIEATYYVSATDGTNKATTTFADNYSILTLTVGPQSPSPIDPPGTATYSISSTWTGSGFSTFVTLSTISWSPVLPTGLTFYFTPATLNHLTTISTLKVMTSGSTPSGNYTFTVHATGTAGTENVAANQLVVAFKVASIVSSDSAGNAKSSYMASDVVYAEFADNGGSSQAVNVYVVDSIPTTGQTLSDIRGNPTTVTVNTSGQVSLIWSNPLTAGTHYLVMDGNNDGKYDPAYDLISSSFTVPPILVDYKAGFGTIGYGSNIQFDYLSAIAITGKDNVYVADTQYGLYANIWMYEFSCIPGSTTSSATYVTQWGGPYQGAYGGGNYFSYAPGEVAIDGSGNVYVADQGYSLIQKFDSHGNFLTQWDGSNGGTTFSSPSGVAVDPTTGNTVVADTYNGLIQVFNNTGSFIISFGGNTSNSNSFLPVSVAVDKNGEIFAVDAGNLVVQEFSGTGNFLRQFGSFSYSTGIAVDGKGNVFVADAGANVVEKFDNSGNFIMQWSGTYSLSNVAVDSTGNVFMSEWYYTGSYLGVVEEFSNSGSFLNQFSGATSIPGPSQFFAPEGAAIDGSGNIFIADSANYRIQEFSSSGRFIRLWGNDVQSPEHGNGQFNYPTGIAYNSHNRYIYVADTYNNRIEVFDRGGNYKFQFGSSYGNPGSGNGQLDTPIGVAIDSSGKVYVVDQNNGRVEVFDANGNYVTQWSSFGYGIAVSATGYVYVCNENSIQEFTTSGMLIRQWGSYGTGDTNFNYAKLIAVDSAGNVYVADELNSRIDMYTGEGNWILNFGTNGHPGALTYPYGVAVDSHFNVYVVDGSTSNVIKVFSQKPLPSKEIASITYTGDTLVNTKGQVTGSIRLSARLSQTPEPNLGDFTKARVEFDLFSSSNLGATPDATFYASVDSSGNALVTPKPTIGTDIWTVRVRIDPANGYWTQNKIVIQRLTVTTSTSYFSRATGNGWIQDSNSQNGKDTFAFAVQYIRAPTPIGAFVFVYHSGAYEYVVVSAGLQGGGLAFTSAHQAVFSGKCNIYQVRSATGTIVNSWMNYRFTTYITDGSGTLLAGSPDSIAVTIYNQSNAVWYQIGTPNAQIPLSGGNIVVRTS